MSDTDYKFDGLDEWEKRLSQVIENQYPDEFRKMVIDVAAELFGRVTEKTPVKTGHLMNEWRVGNIEKRGDEYYIEVYNNVEYAEPVEYGHRTRGGKGFVKGAHMMELSMQDVQKALPGYLREWLNDFLNSHEL
ncbi:MAG: HK97 gp10 family phage protein [Ruminococcus sp.]|nr:HK97 gp10 family phage protein [Ruminococcus sp.]